MKKILLLTFFVFCTMFINAQSTTFSFDSTLFIPDGPSCPPSIYSSNVEVTSFASTDTIQSANDILSICVNIEHSFSGDLGFKIFCPNGQNVVLDPNTHSGGNDLGIMYKPDNGCSPANNPHGTGWNYCWSEFYPNNGTLGSKKGTGPNPIDSTNTVAHTNYFLPGNPLSGLVGCPLNGIWSLQITDDYGMDNGYIFGWSVELPQVICTPPTNQSTTFTSSAITSNATTIGWTRGNGDSVLVVARVGIPVNTDPVNGTTYTANATFGNGTQIGNGNYVVYIGSGTSVDITDLNYSTTYYYAVYEFNAISNCYNTPALTGYATTANCYPTSQATNFSTNGITASSINIGWIRGTGDSVLVLSKNGNAVNSDPINGYSYFADNNFGNGSQIGSGNHVVYKGAGSSVNVLGLTSDENYHYAIYEYTSANLCYKTPALIGNAATTNVGIAENNEDLHNVKVSPNPFTGKTNITYSLPKPSQVELIIIDITGKELIKLVNEKQSKGTQTAVLNASKLNNGIYFYKLKIGDKLQEGKLIRY